MTDSGAIPRSEAPELVWVTLSPPLPGPPPTGTARRCLANLAQSWHVDSLGKRALEAAGTTTLGCLPIPRSLWHLLVPTNARCELVLMQWKQREPGEGTEPVLTAPLPQPSAEMLVES